MPTAPEAQFERIMVMSSAHRANVSADWSLPLRNGQHARFAQLIAGDMDASEAYRQTHPGVKDKTAWECASVLSRKLKDRVNWIKAQFHTENVFTQRERRQHLTEIGCDKKQRATDRIAAIMADAKLAGQLVEKSEVTTRERLTPEQISEAMRRSPVLAALRSN